MFGRSTHVFVVLQRLVVFFIRGMRARRRRVDEGNLSSQTLWWRGILPVAVEGGEKDFEVAIGLILGVKVSVPLFVARLVLVEVVNGGESLPEVEDWLFCCGPEA